MELLRAISTIGLWAVAVILTWVEYKLAMYISERKGTFDWYDPIMLWTFFASIAIVIIGAVYTVVSLINFG